MSRTCERCGAKGPWHDNPAMPSWSGFTDVDYCEICSENLCDDCMKNSECDDKRGDFTHKAYVDPEDED